MALTDAVAAQVMGELHTLTKRIEEAQERNKEIAGVIVAAAKSVNTGKTILHGQNEKFLMDQIIEIKKAVEQITGVKEGIAIAAERTTNSLLTCEGGPIKKLDGLIKQQQDALGWMNRALEYFEKTYILWPVVMSATFGAVIGGITVGIIVKFL